MSDDNPVAADLALIRETLGDDCDDDMAAAFAIQVFADHLRNERIVMTREDLHGCMVRYAEHAISTLLGEAVRAVAIEGGGVGFERTGEPLPAPPVH